MFIVWTETRDNEVKAARKLTKRSAVIAYNKITRTNGHEFKSYGWSESGSADPWIRVAVGLKPFLELGETDA